MICLHTDWWPAYEQLYVLDCQSWCDTVAVQQKDCEETTYENGSVKTEYRSGCSKMNYANGDIRQTYPDGKF